MSAKVDSGAEKRAEILRRYKEHKLTSTQTRAEIRKLEAEIRRGKKKKGGNGK